MERTQIPFNKFDTAIGCMSTSINLRSDFTFVYKYLVNKILAGKVKELVENQHTTTI